MARLYGYTPNEVGEMTLMQIYHLRKSDEQITFRTAEAYNQWMQDNVSNS